jgi:cytosine/adenosine deaminase-related metal-dependent hydrolase
MILTASKLHSMQPSTAFLDNSAVVIKGKAILAIGNTSTIIKKHPGHRIYRFDNAVLLPGLVNTHTHIELPPFLDAIRAEAFPEWVLNLINAKKALTTKDYACATKNNIGTLIQTGTTTVGEICTHGVSPLFIKRSGLRSAVYREIISMDPSASIPHLTSLISRPSPLVRAGISPHTPYTVSEAVLRRIRKSAQEKHLKLCMHVAESKDEIRLLQRKTSGLEKLYHLAHWDLDWAPKGKSSFEYLDRIGFLSPNLLAVHAVQATNEDISLIKKTRVAVAHCPRSNKETGVGRMPLKKFLNAGITVGLGTDSLASSPSLNMWDEMRYALQIHKKDGITAQDIFRLATIGGAKALGMEREIGTLEIGKKADLIAVPLPKKNTGDLYSDLLRETKSCIMTMVNGKVLYLP